MWIFSIFRIPMGIVNHLLFYYMIPQVIRTDNFLGRNSLKEIFNPRQEHFKYFWYSLLLPVKEVMSPSLSVYILFLQNIFHKRDREDLAHPVPTSYV